MILYSFVEKGTFTPVDETTQFRRSKSRQYFGEGSQLARIVELCVRDIEKLGTDQGHGRRVI